MTRKLTVGIVCFPSIGGSGIVATQQALALAERGHAVHLITGGRLLRPIASHPHLTHHEVVTPRYPLFEHPPYTLALASRLAELSRAHAFDLIHVHYAVPHATSAWLAREMLGEGAPLIVTSLHGTDVTRVGSDPAYRETTAFSVARSDAVTTPSAFLREEAHLRLGVPATTHIEVLPNFVDTERFSPPGARQPGHFDGLFKGEAGGPVLFHVSTFRPVKRTTDLVDVLLRVRETMPARLVCVGDGPERARTEERARTLGLSDHVHFFGRRNDFVSDLRQADAFLLPSESESFGVAALEALSAGVPVFGYRVGGLPEVVTEEVGRLVRPFDVDALAKSVVDVLSDPPLARALRARAREHVVSTFRRDPAIDRYERFLHQTIEGKR